MSETTPLLSNADSDSSPPRNLNTTTDTQHIHLSSGRTLCYAEYGDPNGFPLIYLHGFPSSRLEASVIHYAALKRNIRILAPDRPGFGESDFDKYSTLKSVVKDIKEMVKLLYLEKWAVLGISGGGPFAIGVARWSSRKDGLIGVGVGCGAPYWKKVGTVGMPWYSRILWWMGKRTPGLYRYVSLGIIWAARRLTEFPLVQRWMERVLAKERIKKKERGEEMNEEESLEEERKRTMRMVFEGFKQGIQPMERELGILTGYWGFECEDVEWNKVYMWHGRGDRNVPISGARSIAGALQHAELREYDGDHGEIITKFDDILDTLVPEAEREAFQLL